MLELIFLNIALSDNKKRKFRNKYDPINLFL